MHLNSSSGQIASTAKQARRPIRVAAVTYLNTRPLVYGLDSRPDLFALQYDVPSRCAARLHDRSVDLAMLPAIEYLRQPDYRVVPDIAVTSIGSVNSVALYTARKLEDIGTIALDSSSRTSVALLRILCVRRFGIKPRFVTVRPDLPAMLAASDAALLIGDAALFADHGPLKKIDLGAEWTAMTGLPFVWAFWAGRAGAVQPAHVAALRNARDAGMSSLESVAVVSHSDDPKRAGAALAYLQDNLRFTLAEYSREGLDQFFAAAVEVGIVPETRPLRFFDG